MIPKKKKLKIFADNTHGKCISCRKENEKM